jgi:hypothetical protein
MSEERRGDTAAEQSRDWVEAVLMLQNQISTKLMTIGFLKPGEDDLISHHLAEVAYGGSVLATRLIPLFLTSDGDTLSTAAVDLMEDMREIKDSIEAAEDELIQLMNYLNK